MKRIVVGLDGRSEGSRHALRWAAREARRWGAQLQVVSAWSYPSLASAPNYGVMPPAEEMTSSQETAAREVLAGEGLDEPTDLEVDLQVVENAAAPALLKAAEGADLLVVGARGLGGFMGLLLGSVSQHCASHATCPVVVVHLPADD